MSAFDEVTALTETAKLEPTLGQVLAYGAAHPDEFGTYGLVWQGDGASVAVSFTSDLDQHRSALAVMVDHPDELIVCQAPMTGAVAQELQAMLLEESEGRVLSIGGGLGPIPVVLAAGEELLAAELLDRYGNALELTVGALAYPIDQATSVCAALPQADSVPGLDISIVPPPGPLTADGTEHAQLTVRLSNVGDSHIRFGSGYATGTVLDRHGNVVGASGVAVPAIGLEVDLAPGASTDLPLVVNTASCDPSLGYTLSGGEYQLVASVRHAAGAVSTLRSAPLPIVIG